jgi:hypothetical protein
MIFARGRVGKHGIRDTAVGDPILAHCHRHRHHRGHWLDAGDIDFRKLLDEGEHGVELTAQVLDLVIGNRYARQVRDAADGIGVYGHSKSPTFNRNNSLQSNARPSLYQRRRNEPTAGTRASGPLPTADLDRIALAAHPI